MRSDAHEETAAASRAHRPSSRSRTRWRLIARRTVWCPTFSGWLGIFLLFAGLTAWWLRNGESFLSLTERLPAEGLVLEGWIGRDGVRAAAQEFSHRGYRYLVTTGGPVTERWGEYQGTYADLAKGELVRLGIPETKVIVAPAAATARQRTFSSAAAALQALHARGEQPRALDVFTLGPHARRSRLVFAKVCEPATKVGVISWTPPVYQRVPWWHSSERIKDLLTETAGYVYEAFFNSGRSSNVPGRTSMSVPPRNAAVYAPWAAHASPRAAACG